MLFGAAPTLSLLLLTAGAPYASSKAAATAIAEGAEDTKKAIAQLKAKGRPGIWALNELAKKEKGARRGRVLEAIGHFRTPECEYVLRKAVKTSNMKEKAGALRGMGHLQSTRVASVLAANATSPAKEIRDAVLAAMLEIGLPMKKRATKLLDGQNAYGRAVALGYFIEFSDPAELDEILTNGLSDSAEAVQLRAIELVGQRQSIKHAPLLLPLLRDERTKIALASTKAYAAAWTPTNAQALVQLVTDPKTPEPIWREAALSLRGKRVRAASNALGNAIVACEKARRDALIEIVLKEISKEEIGGIVAMLAKTCKLEELAQELLKRIGEPAEDAAIAHLSKANDAERRAIVRFLATRPKARVGAKLIGGAKNGDVTSRVATIGLLAQIVDPAIMTEMIEISSDESPEVRVAAIRAIGGLDSKEIQEALKKHLKDKERRVRLVALEALAKKMTKPRTAIVMAALSDEDEDMRLKAINLVSPPRTQKVLDALLVRLNEGTSKEKVAVVVAIKKSKMPVASGLLIDLVTHRDPAIRKAALKVVNRR